MQASHLGHTVSGSHDFGVNNELAVGTGSEIEREFTAARSLGESEAVSAGVHVGNGDAILSRDRVAGNKSTPGDVGVHAAVSRVAQELASRAKAERARREEAAWAAEVKNRAKNGSFAFEKSVSVKSCDGVDAPDGLVDCLVSMSAENWPATCQAAGKDRNKDLRTSGAHLGVGASGSAEQRATALCRPSAPIPVRGVSQQGLAAGAAPEYEGLPTLQAGNGVSGREPGAEGPAVDEPQLLPPPEPPDKEREAVGLPAQTEGGKEPSVAANSRCASSWVLSAELRRPGDGSLVQPHGRGERGARTAPLSLWRGTCDQEGVPILQGRVWRLDRKAWSFCSAGVRRLAHGRDPYVPPPPKPPDIDFRLFSNSLIRIVRKKIAEKFKI